MNVILVAFVRGLSFKDYIFTFVFIEGFVACFPVVISISCVFGIIRVVDIYVVSCAHVDNAVGNGVIKLNKSGNAVCRLSDCVFYAVKMLLQLHCNFIFDIIDTYVLIGVQNMEKNATIIALSGKGGVGKTSISAAIVKLLVQNFPDKKILAIDADPAVGLSTALGIDVKMTIDDIRKEIVETVEDGQTKAAIELLGDARYKIFDALVETDGFAFIAVGRPESAGCYCKINTYLKEVISILSSDFDYVVIDGEAGIEQINRRVMEKVTHLLLITDASKKGTQVISTIKSVADELVMYKKIGAIVNRIPDDSVIEHINTNGIPVLSYIPTDSNLAIYDIEGKNITRLPDDSNVVEGARKALVEMEILK